MGQKIKQTLITIVGFLLLFLLLYASYRVLLGGWNAYKSLSDNSQIAIALGFLSLVGTLFSLYYTKIKDRQLQIEAGHTDKKQRLYDEFMQDIINMLADPKKADDEKFLLRMKKKFMSNSLLWSNPKVLQVYRKFRKDAQLEESEPMATYDVATLILAFREDLGLSNKGVDEQVILEILYDEEQLKNFGLNFK